MRPEYCPSDLSEDEDCPACGATPERGVCKARNPYPKIKPLVEVVLVRRETVWPTRWSDPSYLGDGPWGA